MGAGGLRATRRHSFTTFRLYADINEMGLRDMFEDRDARIV